MNDDQSHNQKLHVPALLPFPIDESWQAVARATILNYEQKMPPMRLVKESKRLHNKGKPPRIVPPNNQSKSTSSLSPNLLKQEALISRFADQRFRKWYFDSIGHEYVMRLIEYGTKQTGDPIGEDEWEDCLGVSRTTLWRWRNNEVFAKAEKFFAAQLLVMDREFAELPLACNSEMMLESIVGVIEHMNTELGIDSELILNVEEFSILEQSMTLMTLNDECRYNPFDTERTSKENDQAIFILAQSFEASSAKKLRSILDQWGKSYSVFSHCYHEDWVAPEVTK